MIVNDYDSDEDAGAADDDDGGDDDDDGDNDNDDDDDNGHLTDAHHAWAGGAVGGGGEGGDLRGEVVRRDVTNSSPPASTSSFFPPEGDQVVSRDPSITAQRSKTLLWPEPSLLHPAPTWGIWISCLIWMLLVPFQPLLVEVVMALFWPYMPGMGETMEGWLDIWRWVRRTWSAGL